MKMTALFSGQPLVSQIPLDGMRFAGSRGEASKVGKDGVYEGGNSRDGTRKSHFNVDLGAKPLAYPCQLASGAP
jgi:hypothetical protein